jgi:uncharacterized protein (DUF433 family)
MNTGRIAVNPQIHFGKPFIAGTRITVQSVLELLTDNLSFDEIIRGYYPELQVEDIQSCNSVTISWQQIQLLLSGQQTG